MESVTEVLERLEVKAELSTRRLLWDEVEGVMSIIDCSGLALQKLISENELDSSWK